MSNLKDTDIDDLFRRASDKYPLRTDKADWDQMASALDKEPPPPADTVDADDKRRKRRFFWLFLLLPLAGAGYFVLHYAGNATGPAMAGNTITQPATAGRASTPPATSTGTTTETSTGPSTGTTTARSTATPAGAATSAATSGMARPATTEAGKTALPPTADHENDRTASGDHGNDRTAIANNDADPATMGPGGNRQSETAGSGDRFSSANTGKNSHGRRNGHSAGNTQYDQTSKPDNTHNLTAAPGERQPGGVNPIANPSVNPIANPNVNPTANPKVNPTVNPNANPSIDPIANRSGDLLTNHVQDRLFYDLQRAPFPRDYQLAVNVTSPETKTAPAAKKDTGSAKTKKHKTAYFYAGVVGAPDLSTVKMQSVKSVGSTFGLLLGYSLNSRWSIESGVYVDRKKYYTNGEYFNTKDANLPPNSDLLNVDGVCYMWEIPLNLRYNFNPGAKTAWFATAGFSTYLMSHENYTYDWKWYGGSNTWDSTVNIHKPSQYPFSIINLSAGFEQRLGKIGNLRVEPYVRLPLTGLGTGKLSIMSAGVNIGFTRQLW